MTFFFYNSVFHTESVLLLAWEKGTLLKSHDNVEREGCNGKTLHDLTTPHRVCRSALNNNRYLDKKGFFKVNSPWLRKTYKTHSDLAIWHF